MTRPEILPLLSVPSTRTRQRVRARDWPRPPRRDPHMRVIAQLIELAGPNAALVGSSSRPWASATFIGAQHRVILCLTGENLQAALTDFADRLPDAEFSISGHIVADACIDQTDWESATRASATSPAPDQADKVTLRLTVLTIEDW